MHGCALERRTDVLADEAAAFRQSLDPAVEEDAAVRQLARTLAGEHQHRADASVDVDPGVGFRRAGGVRKRVELVLEVEQPLAQRAQHRRALVEGHCAQRRPARAARPGERRADVEAASRRLRDDLPRAGVAQRHAGAGAVLPPAPEIALQPHSVLPPPAARAACQAPKLESCSASVTSKGAGVHQRSPCAAAKRRIAPSTRGSPIASAWNIGPPRCSGKP